MLKFWINNRKTIIPVSTILMILLVIPSLFFSITFVVFANNFLKMKSFIISIDGPDKYEITLIYMEIALTIIALSCFTGCFIIRNFSEKFRKNPSSQAFLAGVGMICFFIANLLLLSSEYKDAASAAGWVNKNIDKVDDKSLVQELNILKYAFLSKVIIISFTGVSAPIFILGLFSQNTLEKWLKLEKERKIIKINNQKYKNKK